MVHDLIGVQDRLWLPEGYLLRLATAEDATGVGSVLAAAFGDPWSPDKVNEYLLKNVNVPKSFVIEHRGKLVAHASYQIKPEDHPNSGWVHFVGADPAHAGLGLGSVVTWAAMREALVQRKVESRLNTDDFRLPAIRTYLKLGFKPDRWHGSHAARWDAVLTAIEQFKSGPSGV